jgi:NAD(P)-dependent dehydrogenase (short-subunit alcohol dehydrogenase family)
MGKFDDKVAVITGGTSGIGLEAAAQFAKEGAHVFITGRRQTELDKAVKLIGENATGIQGDISNLNDLDRLFEAVKEKKGHLDILFANAGLGSLLELGEITEEHYYKTFDVNVKGTIFTVQKALPLFPNKVGSIIITGSIAGSIGTPAFSIYGASKAAIRQLLPSWILDLKGTQIRINVVSPGNIYTPAYDELFGDNLEHVLKNAKDTTPLGRLGTVQDIASAVMFLASKESSYINGIELFVDGGQAQI